MNKKIREYLSLLAWITGFVGICNVIGRLSNSECSQWVKSLNISPYSLPDSVAGMIWLILYIILAIVGWLLWQQQDSKELKQIKTLYISQMIVNIVWMPLIWATKWLLFSFIWSVLNFVLVDILFMKTYKKWKTVGLLLFPYLLWMLYAVYLHYYFWRYN